MTQEQVVQLMVRYNQILALLKAERVDQSDRDAVKACLSETVQPKHNYDCYIYFYGRTIPFDLE
ncbi:hypothetical protein BECP10_00013 [Escherichia phage vB_EcoS-BECP10]|uniref:Uncharacterized protein n=1 Tax=Escherichia phage vB_EcoS-BECP10 TaxID=2797407 RepID=A0A7T7GU60_9CAUD|nr:hypothetical protein BECP10_00013 [Escherichia phage vB_EcoS-BECP10]